MNRSLAVTRMHLVDKRTLFGMPGAILALIVVINAIIWIYVPRGGRHTGGAASAYLFVAAIAALAVARGMPFALGMGASRRAFALGTLTMSAILALVFGTSLFALGLIEKATGGWGAGGHFFFYSWMNSSGPVVWWILVTVPFLTMAAIGGAISTIYLRWHVAGMFVTSLAVVLVLGIGAILLTAQHSWISFGDWFGDRSPLSIAGLFAAIAVAFAALAWTTLRRTAL
jgi:hypothetical protein